MKHIGEAPQCDKDDVNTAVDSAEKAAFQKWKKSPAARERGKDDDGCSKKT